MVIKMISKGKTTLIVICSILLLAGISYWIVEYTKPFRYAKKISNLPILYGWKIDKYEYFVDDFDGSYKWEVIFIIPKDESKRLEAQCLSHKYSHMPLHDFPIGKVNDKYLNKSDEIYYKYTKSEWNPRGYDFILFNKNKNILLVMSEKTY